MKRRHLLLLIALIAPILIHANVLFAQPLVTGVAPNRGPTGGGTLVTITGSDLSDATAVTFGGRAAQSFTVVNSSTIQAQAPVGTIGTAQVAVASASGVSPVNSPDDLFVYVGVWFAYETNTDDGTVTVINVANNTAGFIIPVGNQPNGIAITPDAKTAYVVNFGSNDVTPIDLATNTPGDPIPVGGQPMAIAITIDGKTAFVTNQLSNDVTPIDLATNTPESSFPVGLSPISIAATPNNVIGYVANFNESDITVFDM